MKKVMCFAFAFVVYLSAASQTYEDGLAAGIRDAEELKGSVSSRSADYAMYYNVRHKVDPTLGNGIGEVSTGNDCGAWSCAYVVKHQSLSDADMNITLWNDSEVQQRRDYLYSRYNESVYWQGIYDGFLMRWFFF